MITALEERRLHRREQTRSAASGPEFSVPSLSAVSDMLAMARPPSAPACAAIPAAAPTGVAAPSPLDLSGLLGRSIGSGQCVALVRAAQPGLGPSSTWQAGAPVQGDLSLAPGTPIATFDPSNRYANALDGSSHAAIYLGQDSRGLTVLDQWAGSAAAVRTIPWESGGVAANTGSAFRTVRSA